MATLTCPIPSSRLAAAPATLALSHLDEGTGIWQSDGTAARQGNNYVGQVSHFSNWNYNAAYSGVSLTCDLTDLNGSPLSGVLVQLSASAGVTTAVTTNSLGQATAIVPAGAEIILSLSNECGQIIYTQNIPALSQDSDIGTIKAGGNSSIVTFKGTLQDCSGTPVKNGLAHFVINGTMYRVAPTDANGNFSYTWVNCAAAGTTVNVLGTDETTLQKSVGMDFTITNQVTDFGNISVCGSSAEQFIKYNLDGKDYSLLRNTTQNDSLVSYTTNLSGVSQLNILGGNSSNSAKVFFSLNNVVAAGTYAASGFLINGYSGIRLIQPFNVTFTNFADAPGEFYEGALSGKFTADGSAASHSINLTFKVMR